MGDQGNLQLSDIERKREAINKTGGINSKKSVFQTDNGDNNGNFMMPETSNLYMNRVESLANYGTVSGNNRSLIQNSYDLNMKKNMGMSAGGINTAENKTEAKENRETIRARADLKVFSGDVMQKGVFTPKAKEAGRHFFRQVMEWAGEFDDSQKSFYKNMGISGVLDCLYVDGMSLKSFVKEQYYYKASNDPATEQQELQNYVALIAARGEHVITLVRPKTGPEGAEVEFKNMETDLTEVGPDEAAKANRLKERGNQVRSTLKKRMEKDLIEQVGYAYRKANGQGIRGLDRLGSVHEALLRAGGSDTEEYRSFDKAFEKYNGGLQKLGLKPGRTDINSPVTEELIKRCRNAIDAADRFYKSSGGNEAVKSAVKYAMEELEKDLTHLEAALDNKLRNKNATIGLEELLDGISGNNDDNDSSDNDNDNDGDEGVDNPEI